MVQSRNTTVGYTVEGISYMGLSAYRKIMVGGRTFEFYNNHNVKDYIQIPWDEVNTIVAPILFKDRKIPRFAVMTESNGTFSFSSRDNKTLLRVTANYVDEERMVHSLSFLGVIK